MKNSIDGSNEWSNIDIVRYVCQEVDKEHDRGGDDTCENLITFFKDCLGHNRRYAIDATKIKTALKWAPSYSFEQ